MAQEFAKAFYTSKRWKKARQRVIEREHGLCQRCGCIGEIVHHKILLTESNINDTSITLDDRNLELVCWRCHNAIDHEHLEDDKKVFTEDGDYLPSEIYPPH